MGVSAVAAAGYRGGHCCDLQIPTN